MSDVGITVLIWKKVYDGISSQRLFIQSKNSNTTVWCESCLRLVKKTLARRQSFAKFKPSFGVIIVGFD